MWFQKCADANGEILYGLYAVVVHHGMSLHSGHYTAFVRQRPVYKLKKQLTKVDPPQTYDRTAVETGNWYSTNDSWINSVYEISEVQRCQAYLLFYELLPLM